MNAKSQVLALFMLIGCASTNADVLSIGLDVSGSTPILDKSFMQSVLPQLSTEIQKLPLGSVVKVFNIGDDKVMPINIDLLVQRTTTNRGAPADELAKTVPTMIFSYSQKLLSGSARLHGESSLSPAVYDAAKACQENKPCKFFFLTDGMEHQPGVIEWPRQFKKPLPKIPNLNLKGMSVTMYGVGTGVSSEARLQIEQHWNTWLKDAGAGTVDLRKL